MKNILSVLGMSALLVSCSAGTVTFGQKIKRESSNSDRKEIVCPIIKNNRADVLPIADLIADLDPTDRNRSVFEDSLKEPKVKAAQIAVLTRPVLSDNESRAQKDLFKYYVDVRKNEKIHAKALNLITMGVDLRKLSGVDVEAYFEEIQAQSRSEASLIIETVADTGVTWVDFRNLMLSVVTKKEDSGLLVYPSDVRSQFARALIRCSLYR